MMATTQKASRVRPGRWLVLGVALCLFLLSGAPAAHAEITVAVSGPGGKTSQALPDTGGAFDVNLPLNRNSVNNLTVTATDKAGNTKSRQLSITQVSLESVAISQFTSTPLAPERIEQLVNDGVINLADPQNYNVSEFAVVLTIGGEQVPISVPIAMPREAPMPSGFENIRIPRGADSGGGAGPLPPIEVVVFEQALPSLPGVEPPPIPGVLIIEGRIKSLKEFYSCRLLLMNASGIFTLSNVSAVLSFPDGGLSNVLPADGIVSFGDILPGDGTQPGQVEKEFIIRGDEIGVRHVKVNFGGKVTGPGIPADAAIPFNGSAVTDVEVKGPPSFQVEVYHPDQVEKGVPYELRVDITNTGELPALYASLDLDVGADGEIVTCSVDPATGQPVYTPVEGASSRPLGHIYAGKTVSQTFTILPSRSGPITSCTGASDQNISLQVYVGTQGCSVGHFPPQHGVPTGIPTVTVVPVSNATQIGTEAPVVAFFSEKMIEETITTGQDASFNVYNKAGDLLPGQLRFDTISDKTVAIWQFKDNITNRLAPDSEYSVVILKRITDRDGNQLFSEWRGTFTTTGTALNDHDPPVLTLIVQPPVLPNYVLPGQIIRVNAYATDQASGVVRVEARLKDLDSPDAKYELVDQKSVLAGDLPPYIFSVDSAKLEKGHDYQLMATAYDYMGNSQNASLSLTIASSADPPTVTLPANPSVPVLQGISVDVTPTAYTGGVREIRYFLDSAAEPFATGVLAPYQAFVSTLTLSLGTHTVRAVAVDGLDQHGEATLTFELVENRSMPVVSYGSAASGTRYLVGTSVLVTPSVTDPVGVQSVAFYLNGTKGTPIANTVAPFSINTSELSLGTHRVTCVATNRLGVSNDPNDAASYLEFSVVEPPPGTPPAAPTITSVSYPENGKVTIRGTSVPGARIDITNTTLGFTATVQADGAGVFSATLDAGAGNVLSAVAYDLAQSRDPSPPTAVTVQAAPVLESITVTPTPITFTSFTAHEDLAVTGHYAGGATANLTSRATFASTAQSVVGVTAEGRVAPIANGTARIEATVDGIQGNAEVSVNVVTLVSISVEPASLSMVAVGDKHALTVTGHYSNGSTQPLANGVSFAPSDTRVATVSVAGEVTAVWDGQAEISVFVPGVAPVPVPVTVNTGLDPAPTLQITAPATGTTVERDELVSVVTHAADALGGVTRIVLEVTGATGYSETRQITPASLSTDQTFSFRVLSGAALGGAIDVAVHAVDTSGKASATAHLTLTVGDKTAPTVSITNPANLSAFNYGDTVAIRVAASDIGGLTQIRWATTGSLERSGFTTLSASTTSTEASFTLAIPFGVTHPDVTLHAYARDASGNEGTATPIHITVTGADITPPQTVATAVSNPGASALTTVSYRVLDGLEDLDHVELFFRRNGIGTFSRYTRADAGNEQGVHHPQTGAYGSIVFDSTRMGGDGTYEFYTVGVDQTGNREAAPTSGGKAVVADQQVVIAAGTVWQVVNSPLVIGTSDTTYDDKNLRVVGVTLEVRGHHLFHNVELLQGATLTHVETDTTQEGALDLSAWTLTVDGTSAVNVDARGYLGGYHNGTGNSGRTAGNADGATYRSAGSYGGPGARWEGTSNSVYGGLVTPVDLGSGGARGGGGEQGGDGGGRVQITAVNVVTDGAISANGGTGRGNLAGSGSGGSVYLIASTLSGNGMVTANGGGAELGGGGGRVAVRYVDMSTMDAAHITALGGQGNHGNGGNGTVFLLALNEGNGTLVIDGQGASSSFSPLPIPPGYAFDNIIIRNNARVIADSGLHMTGRLSVLNGSIVTHSVGLSSGLDIEADEVVVDDTSSIDVSAKGYRGGYRDGNGANEGETLGGLGATYRSAGSYGGYGGAWEGATNTPYGQPYDALYLGSGGARGGGGEGGGNGGGRVTITARKTLRVDGSILANGGGGAGNLAGSGSGGSIQIETSLLQGAGTIAANGGAFELGGGGGRVAIRYEYSSIPGQDFDGTRAITAFGGHGNHRWGSAGTVWLKRGDQTHGDLFVDDNVSGATSGVATSLPLLGFGHIVALTDSTITTDGIVKFPSGNGLAGLEINPNISQDVTYTVVANTSDTLTLATSGKPPLASIAAVGDFYCGVYRFDNVYFRRGGFLVIGDSLVVGGALSIDEYGCLTHFDATKDFETRLDLTVDTLYVAGSASINLDKRGYLGGYHNGTGDSGRTLGNTSGSTYRSAGSHGGLGSTWEGVANAVYDSVTNPVALGSGGARGAGGEPGGDGGGWARIQAREVVVDGSITANGETGYGNLAGCGSGGTINMAAASLSGNGTIRANGGGGELGAGGGRIAVRYGTLALDPSRFQVVGGQGNRGTGGNGTLFLKGTGQALGDLVVDGLSTSTPNASTPLPSGYSFDNMTMRNNARVVADVPISVTGTVSILSGSMLTHSTNREAGLAITANLLTVDATSTIDISEKGYPGGYTTWNHGDSGLTLGGLAGATYRSGGSYGGSGGQYEGMTNLPYGHPANPDYLGSGGARGGGGESGGNGGGRVHVVAEAVVIDGTILANGGQGRGNLAGSGSGGSVSIAATSVSGAGAIQANGGAHELGGGGGRIAIVYHEFGGAGNDLGGTRDITAWGGHGNRRWGSAGTVLLRQTAQANGDLYFDDGVDGSASQAVTRLPLIGFGRIADLSINTITTDGIVSMLPNALAGIEMNPNIEQGTTYTILANSANTITVDVSGKPPLTSTASVGDTYAGTYRFDNMFLRRGACVVIGDRVTVGDTMALDEYGVLTHHDATTNFESRLELTVGTLDISPTGAINVDARGYLGGYHNGTSDSGRTLGNVNGSTYRSAGSYGGQGGQYEGQACATYGEPNAPAALGSGGARGGGGESGGDGGGWIAIRAEHVIADGTISANGGNGGGNLAGSGSGGTISIETSTLDGAGTIRACGGAHELGGGGGRIAVYYGTMGFDPAHLDVQGGQGSHRTGGNGTLFLKSGGQASGTLIIDGQNGSGFTPLEFPAGFVPDSVIFRNNAQILLSQPLNVHALTVRDNSQVLADAPISATGLVEVLAGSAITHSVESATGLSIEAGQLVIDATSRLDVSGKGYRGGRRDGNNADWGLTANGTHGADYRSGGSYGGLAGTVEGATNPVYGDPATPTVLGSGGSRGAGGEGGGNGGGRIAITAHAALQVDGTIAANGGSGGGNWAGSGSGGSILISTPSLSGTGSIQADGGAYEVGGGGGRVAAYYGTLTMTSDRIRALGGQGTARTGGHGTVFLKANSESGGTLVVDGQNLASGTTPLRTPASFSSGAVIVRNGAKVLLDQALDVATLTIRETAQVTAQQPLVIHGLLQLLGASTLTHPVGLEAGLDIDVDRVLIDSTSRIDVTGKGYRGGRHDGNSSDNGQTLGGVLGASYRSAGSYGGFGGVNEGVTNPLYGQPSDAGQLGSGGTRGAGGEGGGNGGGRVSLVVHTSLEVNGAVSANGGQGGGNWAGSGSGGGIAIDTALLKGTGTIEANGGAYELGGGGGRVAIVYDTLGNASQNFSDLHTITAFGGRGAARLGSAGTVFLRQRSHAQGDVYIDDGVTGATTSVFTSFTRVGRGHIASLTTDTITTDGAVTMLPGGLVGLEFNPNIGQDETYIITANTANTITVDLAGHPVLTAVAAPGDAYAGVHRFGNLYFRRGGALVMGDDRLVVTGTMLIDEYGKLTHYDATTAYETHLDITAGTLYITDTGMIDVDTRGYLGGRHNGTADSGRTLGNVDGSTYRSGGSYAGLGGVWEGTANAVYGDRFAPAALGSGGSRGAGGEAGGDGGGWVMIRAADLTVDGVITSGGGTGGGNYAGGGSGGSVNITAQRVAGAGVIRANGGGNEIGGGGGRVLIHSNTLGIAPSQVQVQGGAGTRPGNAGTVELPTGGVTAPEF